MALGLSAPEVPSLTCALSRLAAVAEDETKSTVSDTWSTDVLASDSEPPEQNQLERLEEIAEEMVSRNLLGVQEVRETRERDVLDTHGERDVAGGTW